MIETQIDKEKADLLRQIAKKRQEDGLALPSATSGAEKKKSADGSAAHASGAADGKKKRRWDQSGGKLILL